MWAFVFYGCLFQPQPNQEKKTFCLQVMPFWLKDVGATFKRLMDKIFKEQICKNLEVYVDEILVRSKQATDHSKTCWRLG